MINKNNELHNFRQTADLDFFKVFFEPTRYDLVEFISVNPNLSIGEIAEEFKQDRSVISRHLDLLHKHDILIKTKVSRYTLYRSNIELIISKFENITHLLKSNVICNDDNL